MSALRQAAGALFALGLIVGTALDAPRTLPPLTVGDYQAIEADFHVHAFFGDGWLAPWDLVFEARRRNLHAFAITNHNQVFAGRVGRWFSRRVDGPIVLVGGIAGDGKFTGVVGQPANDPWDLVFQGLDSSATLQCWKLDLTVK